MRDERIDLRFLQMVKDRPSEYRIMVDNDSIWIEVCNNDDWDVYYSFDDYGDDFIVYILNLLGFRAEGV